MWTVTMQLGYINTVTVFGYSNMVISLSMNVMAACMEFYPPGHFVSRAPMTILGAPFAPLILQCAAGFVCLQSFC